MTAMQFDPSIEIPCIVVRSANRGRELKINDVNIFTLYPQAIRKNLNEGRKSMWITSLLLKFHCRGVGAEKLRTARRGYSSRKRGGHPVSFPFCPDNLPVRLAARFRSRRSRPYSYRIDDRKPIRRGQKLAGAMVDPYT